MRERLFSAVRSRDRGDGRARSPLVIAFEDIHWADEGMLDLIEYLARWVRGPPLIVCLARDELLDRRPGWGGGRRNATTIAARPARPTSETRELVGALLPGNGGDAEAARRAGRRARRRQPAVRRGDGQPRSREEGTSDGRDAARHRPRRARRPARLARRRSSGALRAARRGGRPDLLGGRRSPARRRAEGRDLARGAARARRRRTSRARAPAAGWPASASTRSSTC